MRITNRQTTEQADTKEISAEIDGFRLWYRLPKAYPFSRSGDPFLAIALLPAMLKGEAIEVDPSLPVSPKLLGNIPLIQEIHHAWNPVLKIIPVHAKTSPAEPLNTGSFSFFSGGVDSTYTFLKRRKEIGHVVFIHGFDFFPDRGPFETAVARNSSFVRGYGKTLIPVETNYFPFSYRYNLSRHLTQGSALASVALLLGFSRAYMPGSLAYSQLIPSGSHPLTDPLYSNECVETVHDGGEARRVDKVVKVAGDESALANLRVCFEDMNVNCGKCIKCLRTMAPLELLGARSAPFPPLPSRKTFRRMNWKKETMYLKENIELAVQKGGKDLGRTLSACLRKSERAQLLADMDKVLLGGFVKRARRKLGRASPGVRRITAELPGD